MFREIVENISSLFAPRATISARSQSNHGLRGPGKRRSSAEVRLLRRLIAERLMKTLFVVEPKIGARARSRLVNCAPWSVLKISGREIWSARRKASCRPPRRTGSRKRNEPNSIARPAGRWGSWDAPAQPRPFSGPPAFGERLTFRRSGGRPRFSNNADPQ